jgi:ribonuclease M5
LIKINEVVIVEGKYDKIKLSSIIDAIIIETKGFSIFKNKEQLELIRRLAASKGILIITDSDSAGFKIRSFLGGTIPKQQVKHAYIPDIFGKEQRKTQASKEGKLGVEGVPKIVILKSLENAGVLCAEISVPSKKISKTDLYEDGLTGGEGSFEKRQKLLRKLELPMRLSTNALLEVLNAMMDFDEYKRVTHEL